MSDLSDRKLKNVSRVRDVAPWETRLEEFEDIESMVTEIRRRRAVERAARENLTAVGITEDGPIDQLVCTLAGRYLELRQKASVAQTASAEHAAMLLLDGLTGLRSANVFEAARNAEAVIAGIPGRPVVQEPSARGRDLHDAAAALVDAFMAGAAYVQDYVLERGASVGHAAEQHIRDHGGASKVVQVTETEREATDHQQTATADQMRAAVMEAIAGHGSEQFEGVFIAHRDIDAIADRVTSQLASTVPISTADRSILKRLRDNEARAGNSIGHLGDDLRRANDAAVELLDRLLGGAR